VSAVVSWPGPLLNFGLSENLIFVRKSLCKDTKFWAETLILEMFRGKIGILSPCNFFSVRNLQLSVGIQFENCSVCRKVSTCWLAYFLIHDVAEYLLRLCFVCQVQALRGRNCLDSYLCKLMALRTFMKVWKPQRHKEKLRLWPKESSLDLARR